MENKNINKAIESIESQMAKLNAVQSVLNSIKTQMEWCCKYDREAGQYSTEVEDEKTYSAYEAVLNDICKLYSIKDC